ncbi:hypothetical protein KIPB_011443, partial [Kipferlia bialata]
ADVVSSTIVWGLIALLFALFAFGQHWPRDCKVKRLVSNAFCQIDRSQQQIVNASKIMLKAAVSTATSGGKADRERYRMDDHEEDTHYVETESRGSTLGGLTSGILYVIGAGAVLWTLYVSSVHMQDHLQLPEDLFREFTSGQPPYLRQRDVKTTPYNALDSDVATYLSM